MDIRLREHHNKAKLPLSDDYASTIGQHAYTTDHHFRPEDITYLAREGNKMARGIKEAIYTRTLDPPLNRGGGLPHFLPHAYDNILSTTIRPPKPPRPSAPGSPTPPSTSMTPDPRATHQDPATASCASPSSTLPSPRLRPPQVLRKRPIPPQQPCAASAAPARTPPPQSPEIPLLPPPVPPRIQRRQLT
jgi:hypothetical protein